MINITFFGALNFMSEDATRSIPQTDGTTKNPPAITHRESFSSSLSRSVPSDPAKSRQLLFAIIFNVTYICSIISQLKSICLSKEYLFEKQDNKSNARTHNYREHKENFKKNEISNSNIMKHTIASEKSTAFEFIGSEICSTFVHSSTT